MIKTESKQKIITLQNGTRIILEEDFNVRSCSMSVHIASGSRYETPETAGASHFIEHMVFKGTKTRTAKDIALMMDSVGGHLNAFTTREYTRCTICGRPHAVLKKYGICRICFRELAYKGQIPGVRKSSW